MPGFPAARRARSERWRRRSSPRLLYLRTLLLAMESLRNGVPLLCDDFFDPPVHDLDRLGVVFLANEDAGILRRRLGAMDGEELMRDAMPRRLANLPAPLYFSVEVRFVAPAASSPNENRLKRAQGNICTGC